MCPGGNCWHEGACVVDHIDALSVEHTNRDGAHVRRRKRDGTMYNRPQAGITWTRYRRALLMSDHGMELRCFNCHQVSDNRHRRAHLEEVA